jgi:phospho-N-acetylmuramoyl-pentapeptide-transferase
MEIGIKLLQYLLFSLCISLVIGKSAIPLLKKLKYGQSIREDGPKSHLTKSGTPTMGGIIFITGFLATILINLNFNQEVLVMIFALVSMGVVGFIDDYIIVVTKNNQGLRAYQKLGGQVISAIALGLYCYKFIGSDIIIPFMNVSFDLGILYIPFAVFFVLAVANGVNLTDGLDGLAGSVSAIVVLFFASIALTTGFVDLGWATVALLGSILGYLYYNLYPAKVFMGDAGSLAIGGAISALALIMKMPLFILLVGIIYFIETLSVIIQVISFKTRKKRVFKMSPIHHHFELSGWKETKIVKVFAFVTGIFALISYVSLI